MKINPIIEILIVVLGSIVLGWLVKKLIFPQLYKITRKTKWKFDDRVIESVSKWVIFWFFIGSFFYTLPIFSTLISSSSLFGRKINITEHDLKIIKTIFGSIYIFSLTSVAANIIAGSLQIRSQQDNGHSHSVSSSILENIAKSLIYCVGFIFILRNFGVEIAPLLAALGVGGLAVALALQPTLSNLFSGLQIIASGKINIGDFVQLENGQRGFIKDITWRNTTITTLQNNIIILPNSKMADSTIENFILEDRKITFNVVVGVSYDSDLDLVEKTTIDVIRTILNEEKGGVKDFEPFVRYFQFGENSIGLKAFLQVEEFADQQPITSAFIKELHKVFKEKGIQIPFPSRTIYMKHDN